MNRELCQLVLLRHGTSIWNQDHRFTGWTDIPLSDHGKDQASRAGSALATQGIEFNEVHTSVMLRAHQTADCLLAATNHAAIPRYSSWRLNERHYGQLQGMSKQEIFATWGELRSRRWWRGYLERPPPLASSDPQHPRFDPRYSNLEATELPGSESLCDCQRRLLPYWHEVLAPRIASGLKLLVISHGNTLRALLMHLENISAEAIEQLEIPMCIPLLCRFDKKLTQFDREWLNWKSASHF